MKVLLTGATGFLGSRLLETLSRHPGICKLIASGRTIRPTHHVNHPTVSYQLGDLTDPGVAEGLAMQADCIIHAAALSSPWGKHQDFFLANILATRYLVQAAARQGTGRFVFVSSSSVYVDKRDRFNIKESDPLPTRFINSYAATKREAELEVIRSGLPYIILRPRGLIGRGDTVIMPRLIHAFGKGKLRRIGKGDNLVDLTPVENMVSAVEASLFAGSRALNQIYNISNGSPVFLWEAIGQILKLLGHDFDTGKRVPFWVASALARILELKSVVRGGAEPPLTVYSVVTLARSFTMDISRARENLAYEPRVSTAEAMAEFVDWYREHPWKQ
jgi:nucleoside-diphosphate-sugar epimerase